MADIHIPSKNIYDIKDNFVNNNRIGTLTQTAKKVLPDNHYGEAVATNSYNGEFSLDSELQQDTAGNTSLNVVAPQNPTIMFSVSHTQYDRQYYFSKTIYIPLLANNAYIEDLVLGTDINGRNNISYSIIGKVNKGTATIPILGVFGLSGLSITSKNIQALGVSANYLNPTETTTERYTLPTHIQYRADEEYAELAEQDITTKDNLATAEATLVEENGQKYYKIELTNILVGLRFVVGGGRATAIGESGASTIVSQPTSISCAYEEYIPEEISITFIGNTYGIKLENTDIKVVETPDSGVAHLMQGSELIQLSEGEGNAEIEITGEILENIGQNLYKMIAVNDSNNVIANNSYLWYKGDYARVFRTVNEPKYYGVIVPNESSNALLDMSGKGAFTVFVSTTNLEPPLIKRLRNLLKKWENGKSVITLTCDIDDYYGEITEKVTHSYTTTIIPSKVYTENIGSDSRPIVEFASTNVIEFGENDTVILTCRPIGSPLQNIKLTLFKNEATTSTGYKGIVTGGTGISATVGQRYTTTYSSQNTETRKEKVISRDDENLPMTFHIGDIIIPYAYGTDGNDYYMHTNADGSPKKYIVYQTQITYDGVVMQKIMAREA